MYIIEIQLSNRYMPYKKTHEAYKHVDYAEIIKIALPNDNTISMIT